MAGCEDSLNHRPNAQNPGRCPTSLRVSHVQTHACRNSTSPGPSEKCEPVTDFHSTSRRNGLSNRASRAAGGSHDNRIRGRTPANQNGLCHQGPEAEAGEHLPAGNDRKARGANKNLTMTNPQGETQNSRENSPSCFASASSDSQKRRSIAHHGQISTSRCDESPNSSRWSPILSINDR